MNPSIFRLYSGFVAGLIGIACGAEGPTETTSEQPAQTAANQPESRFGQDGLALGPCIARQSLGGQCMRLKRMSGKPYLDAATTIINPDVVTRDHQSDDSQTWCFTVVDEGMEDPTAPSGVAWATFKIQHRSFSGQYLDAYGTSSNDYKAVLRNGKNSDAQIWRADIDCYAFHLIQQSTGRHLDAYNSTNQDFRAVTRPAQFDGTQDWFVE